MNYSITPRIYPNPIFSGEALKVMNGQNIRSIHVYDMQGRQHEFQETLVGNSGIRGQRAGNYLIKIETLAGEVSYVPLTVLN